MADCLRLPRYWRDRKRKRAAAVAVTGLEAWEKRRHSLPDRRVRRRTVQRRQLGDRVRNPRLDGPLRPEHLQARWQRGGPYRGLRHNQDGWKGSVLGIAPRWLSLSGLRACRPEFLQATPISVQPVPSRATSRVARASCRPTRALRRGCKSR